MHVTSNTLHSRQSVTLAKPYQIPNARVEGCCWGNGESDLDRNRIETLFASMGTRNYRSLGVVVNREQKEGSVSKTAPRLQVCAGLGVEGFRRRCYCGCCKQRKNRKKRLTCVLRVRARAFRPDRSIDATRIRNAIRPRCG